MDDDRYRDSANGIIEAIADRERSDLKLPPSLVCFIIIVYLIVVISYVTNIYERYDYIPFQQMLTVIALFTIGAALVFAIVFSLVRRNRKHSEREARLRKYLLEYCETNDHICGYDLSTGIERMRKASDDLTRIETVEGRRPSVFILSIPIVVSLVLITMSEFRDQMIQVIGICYGISLLMALLIMPGITTFPKRHEDAYREFYEGLESISGQLGIDASGYETTIGYRSFWVFIVFSVLSLGLFLIYWTYLMFKDMNGHFDMQWAFEDNLFRSIRGKEIQIRRGGARRGKDYRLEDMWSVDDIHDTSEDVPDDMADECI